MSLESDRLEISRVEPLVEFINQLLIAADIKHEIAGSYRRLENTIGDLDIVVEETEEAQKFLSRLGTPSYTKQGKLKHSIVSYNDIIRKVEWYWACRESWGAMLLYATGSDRFNTWMRTYARNKGFKLNQYGLFNLDTEEFVAGKKEVDIFKELGFAYIPPELRRRTITEEFWWKWAHEKKIG
jgi:DNA polymerase (family 10)